MRQQLGNQSIKQAMLGVEREVVAHIRKHGGVRYMFCSLRWMKAIDRLVAKKRVRYSHNQRGDGPCYVLRKGRKS